MIAIDIGEWITVTGITPLSFQVDGIINATVQLRGSNKPTKPSNSSDEFQLGKDITTDGLFVLDAPVRFVKAKVSAYIDGSINCYMVGSIIK